MPGPNRSSPCRGRSSRCRITRSTSLVPSMWPRVAATAAANRSRPSEKRPHSGRGDLLDEGEFTAAHGGQEVCVHERCSAWARSGNTSNGLPRCSASPIS